MKKFWDLLKLHKINSKQLHSKISIIEDLSISNDEVAVLAERLEFFLPKFKTFPVSERFTYIAIWSLLISMMQFLTESTVKDFLWTFLFEVVLFTLIATSSFSLIDILRAHLKRSSLGYACFQVWVLIQVFAVISLTVTVGGFYVLNILPPQMGHISLICLIHFITIGIGSVLLLMYYLIRYHELAILSESFELKLAAQNELIKSRISPHFFFNTINVLTSLIESDPKKAARVLNKVSTLFRASFDDVAEIGLDEEIDLCQVFLAIDEARFHDKIRVTWDLPDEDTMYDMVITGLTLQSVLEKVLHHVAEITTETIHAHITAKWENHWVTISIKVGLPKRTLLIKHDLNHQMNFDIQERRLKLYFGTDANIKTQIDENDITATISYSLYQDSGVELHVSNNISTMTNPKSNIDLID